MGDRSVLRGRATRIVAKRIFRRQTQLDVCEDRRGKKIADKKGKNIVERERYRRKKERKKEQRKDKPSIKMGAWKDKS